MCAFLAYKWKQEEPRASLISFSQSNVLLACMLFSIELLYHFCSPLSLEDASLYFQYAYFSVKKSIFCLFFFIGDNVNVQSRS